MGHHLEPWKHMLIRDMIRRKWFTTAQILMLLNEMNVLLGLLVLTYACLDEPLTVIVEVDHEV